MGNLWERCSRSRNVRLPSALFPSYHVSVRGSDRIPVSVGVWSWCVRLLPMGIPRSYVSLLWMIGTSPGVWIGANSPVETQSVVYCPTSNMSSLVADVHGVCRIPVRAACMNDTNPFRGSHTNSETVVKKGENNGRYRLVVDNKRRTADVLNM